MRLQRISLILFAVFIIFIVGGYAQRFPQLKWFNHILMTIVMGAWLGWRIWKNRNLPVSRLNIPVFALLILGFITVPFSDSPRLALENMWLPVIYTVMFFFLVNAFHYAQHKFIRELLFFVTAVVVLLSAYQIASVYFGWGIVRGAEQGWIEFVGQGVPLSFEPDMRIFLPLGVSTQTAGFVAPLIIITIASAFGARKTNRILYIILSVILTVILVFTFSRGGLVSLAVGLASFFALSIIQFDRLQNIVTRRNIVIGMSLLALIAIALAGIIAISGRTGRSSGDNVRRNLWDSATQMIIDNPVTGVGTGLYGRSLRAYRNPIVADDRLSTAHNLYLNTTAENGLGVIVILIGSIGIIGVSWLRLRDNTEIYSERWYLLNGMMAALLGFAVHNLFDTLTVFGSVALALVMIVHVAIEPAKSRLSPIKAYGNTITASALLILVIAYGIWFSLIVDRAHWHFINSINSNNDQFAEIDRAIALDPALNLYTLHHAYLLGWEAYDNSTAEDTLSIAIEAYENSLALEPTWDTGWLNLASLYILDNNLESAQNAVDQARLIAPRRRIELQWAMISEQVDSEPYNETLSAYIKGINRLGYLPLSTFWVETDIRREALEYYIDLLPVDRRYRVNRVHFPERLDEIIVNNPQTASEWWIAGEQFLSIDNDRDSAVLAFTNAIDLNPINGDYYASRARAYGLDSREDALQDLQIARFLGTVDEYPNIIEADLTLDDETREALLLNAIPVFSLTQGFDAVVFSGRVAQFVPYDTVRGVGRGDAVMQVWYDLASNYEQEGDVESAQQLYSLIRLHSPEDERALIALDRLDQ